MKKNTLKSIVFTLALTLLSSASPASDESRGRELVNSLGCKGCHVVEGNGGAMGPALDGVGGRLSEDQIRRILINPKEVNPQSIMPSYERLPKEDLEALASYLEDLK